MNQTEDSHMDLKKELVSFVKETLHIPLIGIAAADDISGEHTERISSVLQVFSRSTPLAAGSDSVLQPRDFLDNARSVIVIGIPAFWGNASGFDDCRADLLGKAEPSHVNVRFLQNSAERNNALCDFLSDRGFPCVPVFGLQFPIKLLASQCGVGFYGKNSIIQHPDYGAWISLSAFITGAELEPDEPIHGECGSCELCLKSCPTGALFAPYRCDVNRCMDFHLGHNKTFIPYPVRQKTGNLLGEGCTICRDVCPKNKNLKTIPGFDLPEDLLYPRLLHVLAMSDDEWENKFSSTLMGFFLMDKRYLIRNAVIALGNFKDARACDALGNILNSGEDELRGYAAWALGSIGGTAALKLLDAASLAEKDRQILQEIETARAMAIR
jgi:epoxyqueuosine reductase QueG